MKLRFLPLPSNNSCNIKWIALQKSTKKLLKKTTFVIKVRNKQSTIILPKQKTVPFWRAIFYSISDNNYFKG